MFVLFLQKKKSREKSTFQLKDWNERQKCIYSEDIHVDCIHKWKPCDILFGHVFKGTNETAIKTGLQSYGSHKFNRFKKTIKNINSSAFANIGKLKTLPQKRSWPRNVTHCSDPYHSTNRVDSVYKLCFLMLTIKDDPYECRLYPCQCKQESKDTKLQSIFYVPAFPVLGYT